MECWNCGNTGHSKKNRRTLKKKEDKNNAVANAVTDEVQDNWILFDSPIDSWVLDLGASFHTIAHHEILENCIAGNHGKVYLADGEPLDVVGVDDVKLKMTNWSVWKIHKARYVPKLM